MHYDHCSEWGCSWDEEKICRRVEWRLKARGCVHTPGSITIYAIRRTLNYDAHLRFMTLS